MTDIIEFIENANSNGKSVPVNDAIVIVNAFKSRQVTQNNALIDKMNDLCAAVAVKWGEGSQMHNVARDFVDTIRAALQEPIK